MTDAIIVTDSDWRVTNANHSATLLLNLPEEHWRGTSLDDVLAEFMLSEPLSKLKSAPERVTSLDISRPYTRPPLFLGARLTRQRDPAGKLLGAVLMARDETDERCDQRVRADFFEMVSQKLRTPLTVLSSYLHLARQLPSDVLQRQWPAIFKACDKELGRMNVAVSTLLDFKALSPGQMEAEVQQADVKAVIAASAYEARRVYSESPVEVKVEVAPDAARADAGAEHLAFILEKLLHNSVKFADKKPVRIVVKAERDSPAWVRISVSDNGPGIPHEYFDRVLSGFVQLESRPAGQTPGLGIGLLMARQVVEAYGGKISIQSRIGEGATVSFTLPYSESSAEGPIAV
jgi:signal transduction histidine kinase